MKDIKEFRYMFSHEPISTGDIVVYLKNEGTGSSTVRKCKFVGHIEEFNKDIVSIRRLSKPDMFVFPCECVDYGIDKVHKDDVVHVIISRRELDE